MPNSHLPLFHNENIRSLWIFMGWLRRRRPKRNKTFPVSNISWGFHWFIVVEAFIPCSFIQNHLKINVSFIDINWHIRCFQYERNVHTDTVIIVSKHKQQSYWGYTGSKPLPRLRCKYVIRVSNNKFKSMGRLYLTVWYPIHFFSPPPSHAVSECCTQDWTPYRTSLAKSRAQKTTFYLLPK